MQTIRYVIDRIDELHYEGNDTDRIADINARERGKRLMTDILALFPKRSRIQTYGPQKPSGFATSRDANKFRIYSDPEFSIAVYWKLEELPRKAECVHYIDIYISSERKELIDQRKSSIDALIEEYSKNTGNKMKSEFYEYSY